MIDAAHDCRRFAISVAAKEPRRAISSSPGPPISSSSSTASVIGVSEIAQRANTVIATVGNPEATLWVYGYVMLWLLAFCWPFSRLMAWLHNNMKAKARSLVADDLIFERRLDIAAALDSIAVIQGEIEAAADGILDKGAVFRLTMLVDELVTNIVHHGGAQQMIDVAILVTPKHSPSNEAREARPSIPSARRCRPCWAARQM